jgi:hypothetical protein
MIHKLKVCGISSYFNYTRLAQACTQLYEDEDEVKPVGVEYGLFHFTLLAILETFSRALWMPFRQCA